MFCLHKQQAALLLQLVQDIYHDRLPKCKGILLSGEVGSGKSFLCKRVAETLNWDCMHFSIYDTVHRFENLVQASKGSKPLLAILDEMECKTSAMGYNVHMTPVLMQQLIHNLYNLNSRRIILVATINVPFAQMPHELLCGPFMNQVIALPSAGMHLIDVYEMFKSEFAKVSEHSINLYSLAQELQFQCKYACMVPIIVREICTNTIRRAIKAEIDLNSVKHCPVEQQDAQQYLQSAKPFIHDPEQCTAVTHVCIAHFSIYSNLGKFARDVKFDF